MSNKKKTTGLTPLRCLLFFLLAAGIGGSWYYQISQSFGVNSETTRESQVKNGAPKTPLLEENVFLHKTRKLNTKIISAVSISPQDRSIFIGSNDKITLLNVDTGETRGSIEQEEGSIVESIAISLNGNKIASGGSDSENIYIWNLPTLDPYSTLTKQAFNVTSLAFSPQADILVSGNSKGEIKIWNVLTSQLKYDPLSRHGQKVTSFAISPDGQILASGRKNGEINIWDLDRGTVKYNRPKHSGHLKHYLKHSSEIKSLAISPDGKKLVSSSRDGEIKIWNLETGKPLHNLIGSAKEVTDLAINPDRQTFVSGSKDGKIKVWNLNTGELRHIYSLSDYNSEFITLAIDSDRQIVVSGHVFSTIKIWLVQQKLADQ